MLFGPKLLAMRLTLTIPGCRDPSIAIITKTMLSVGYCFRISRITFKHIKKVLAVNDFFTSLIVHQKAKFVQGTQAVNWCYLRLARLKRFTRS